MLKTAADQAFRLKNQIRKRQFAGLMTFEGTMLCIVIGLVGQARPISLNYGEGRTVTRKILEQITAFGVFSRHISAAPAR